MHEVSIHVEFFGGLGILEFTIFSHGQEVNSMRFEESGTQNCTLEDGLYLFSGTGVSPDGGTIVSFSEPTVPSTNPAYEIGPGPIYKSFSLHLD